MTSAPVASRLRAVSTSVSPLAALDMETASGCTSALSRFAARAKECCVRVLGS